MASVTFALLIAEATLHICGISYPRFYTADAVLGYMHRPGARGLWNKEGNVYVQINSAGMRDKEHAREKPAGTIRIAVLGDSYAEAFQVSSQETFWAVMEWELETCVSKYGKKVEVLNFGVSGYGTAQELLMLQHRAWEYSPDIVVLAITPANDICNNSRELEHDSSRPYFVYRGDKLSLDNAYLSGWKYKKTGYLRYVNLVQRASDSSRILQVIMHAYTILKLRTISPAINQNAQFESGLANAAFFEPINLIWKEAWKVTKGLIGLMDEEVRKHGARFLVSCHA